tara:strand:- start:19 stop:264 length:246 start_codon:yes stop_codon:yes gene_type:complete
VAEVQVVVVQLEQVEKILFLAPLLLMEVEVEENILEQVVLVEAQVVVPEEEEVQVQVTLLQQLRLKVMAVAQVHQVWDFHN